jgi:hypothetical protein
MNTLSFCSVLLFVILSRLSCVESKCEVISFAKAINEILKEYTKNKMQFDFLIFGKNKNLLKFSYEIITTIHKINQNLGTTEILVKHEEKIKLKLKQSTIIFVENIIELERLNKKIQMQNTDYKRFKHLIIIKQTTNLKQEFSKYRKEYFVEDDIYDSNIMYENFIFCEEKVLKLIEFAMFQNLKKNGFCEQLMQIINRFSVTNGRWKTKNFGMKELVQLNGCLVSSQVATLISKDQELSSITYGIVTMIVMFQKKLNYVFLLHSEEGYSIDFMTTWQPFMDNEISHFYIFFDYPITVTISTGEPYTTYEKFLLPFDAGTWICCGVVFVGAFFIIFLITISKSRKIRSIVYGDRVNSPTMNVLVAFFGQSQTILPSRSFARFILMLFILFCLIIRTGYQGLQFDMIFMVKVDSL